MDGGGGWRSRHYAALSDPVVWTVAFLRQMSKERIEAVATEADFSKISRHPRFSK